MTIKISSAKAKSRRLQKWVCSKVSELTGISWGKDEQIASREMGQSGIDVRLTGDALHAFPWSVECFEQGTLVVTSKGLLPIESLSIGTKVLTHKGRFRKIIATKSHKAKTNKVTVKGCFDFNVTPEHPFETPIPGKWEPIKNLNCVSSILLTNQVLNYLQQIKIDNKRTPNSIILPNNIYFSESLAWAFGLYVAEGCSGFGKVVYTLNNNMIYAGKRLENIFQSYFGIKGYYIRKNGCFQLSFNSVQLERNFSKWFGVGAKKKRIGSLLFMDRKLASNFLIGYYSGDGCFYHTQKGNLSLRCETVSKVLACELQIMWLRFGIWSKIFKAKKKTQEGKNALYTIFTPTENIDKAYDVLCGQSNLRYLCPTKINCNTVTTYDFRNRRIYLPIINQYNNKDIKTVYNIEVAQDKSYVIQGGIVVHNCKYQETWSIPEWIRQAKDNRKPGTDWLLVVRKNRHEEVVVVDAEVFFDILKLIPYSKKGR